MNPFDPYSNPMPRLRGRDDDVEEILSLLSGVKHVSVVAPKLFGKRALLREVAKRATDSGNFSAVVVWDMKAAPTKAETFFVDLARQIWEQWRDAGKYFANGIEDVTGESLIRKCNDWRIDNHRVLLVWKSFDEVLRDTELPDNFLGQLNSLCASEGIRVLTSTRREMPEIVVNQADIGSKLWGKFDIHHLRNLTAEDISNVKAEWEQHERTLGSGAEAAIEQQTGHVPSLVFALLGQLWKTTSNRVALTKADVISAAEETDTRVLKDIWKELSDDTQRLMRRIARSNDGVAAEGISDAQFEPLTKRFGVARKTNGRFHSNSKLFADFAARQDGNEGQLAILFGHSETYTSNIASVLRRRFAQVKMPINTELRVLVSTVLTNLAECSTVSLVSVRQVFSGAASILFNRQFKDGLIPDAWVDEWKFTKWVPECAKNKRVPRTRGHMIQLLRKLHETLKLNPQQAGPLFDLLYEAGNLAQHDDEHEPVSGPFAIAVATTAVELLVLLDQTK